MEQSGKTLGPGDIPARDPSAMTALQRDVQIVPAGTSQDLEGGLNGGLCYLQLEAVSTDTRFLVPKQ